MTIHLSRTAWDDIRLHALEGYPNEIVGLLAGSDTTVSTVYRLENEARHQRRYFEVSLMAFNDAVRELTRKDLRLMGLYHSHPDQPADLSDGDQAWSRAGQIQIVISVRADRVADARAWVANADGTDIEKHRIVIAERGEDDAA